jgi:WD40 repeat protein
MSFVKSSEKSERLHLKTNCLLGFLLLSSLIIGCTPASPTSTSTLSSTTVFLTTPYPTSTPQQTDFPTPQAIYPAQTNPAIKFNSWEIVHDLTYSPDGKYLAVSAGNRIHIYNGDSLEEMTDIQVEAWTNRIAFHPNLPLIILAVKDGTIQFREILSGRIICQFLAHEKGANSLGIHPAGTVLVTTGTDITSKLWDILSIANGECDVDEIGMFLGESFSSPDTAFSPDRNSIALVDLNNIRLRKTSDRKLIALLESEIPVFDIAFSPDGHWLASAQHLDSVTLWDLTHAGNPVATVLQHPNPDLEAYSWRVVFSPDSKKLAAGDSVGSITIWDVSDLRIVETFHLPRAVSALAFSPDGKYLAAGGLDASIWLFPLGQK